MSTPSRISDAFFADARSVISLFEKQELLESELNRAKSQLHDEKRNPIEDPMVPHRECVARLETHIANIEHELENIKTALLKKNMSKEECQLIVRKFYAEAQEEMHAKMKKRQEELEKEQEGINERKKKIDELWSRYGVREDGTTFLKGRIPRYMFVSTGMGCEGNRIFYFGTASEANLIRDTLVASPDYQPFTRVENGRVVLYASRLRATPVVTLVEALEDVKHML